MRLDQHDSQIATAAIQLLEREFADRLEEHPEATGFDYRVGADARQAFDAHDRVTQIVRKLSTAGDHELFDWEAEVVHESLTRYQAALSAPQLRTPPIADENSQFITSDEQRRLELERTNTLLEKFPSRPRESSRSG